MKPSSVVGVFVGITLVKLALAAVWGETADITNIFEQGRGFVAGRDILDAQATGGHPSFFPMGNYLLATACLVVSQALHVPFAFAVKVPAILADLCIAFLLRASPRGGERAAWWYLVNPVTFLLAVYHGQLHTVAVAILVLSVCVAERGRPGLSGAALALAASIRQHFAGLLVPLLRGAGSRWPIALASCAAVGVALNVRLLASAHLDRLLAPTLLYGKWGYTLLLLQGARLLGLLGLDTLKTVPAALTQWLDAYAIAPYVIWTLGYWVWSVRQGASLDLWKATLLFLVGLYVVSPGFGMQWLVWAVPFWLVVNRRQAMWYSFLAGTFLAGSYWQWTLNGKYGVASITEDLGRLSRFDLAGVVAVGAVGLATWGWCVRGWWRLLRDPRSA
ncbi:MAG: hypothetical protein Q8R91_02980 [Candidatus Omnitrophota bacterium]|nr:hypothetical protein [Candidatus Omnitrophota bacterium]